MLRKTMLMLMVSLCTYATTNAQLNSPAKTSLFADYPSTLNISETTLESLFSLPAGRQAVLDFGNNLVLPGSVLRNDVKYSNLQTIVVRTSVFENALLQVSRIMDADRSIYYTGRIINEKSADGFEIKKNANGTYQLQKFATDRILEGCFL